MDTTPTGTTPGRSMPPFPAAAEDRPPELERVEDLLVRLADTDPAEAVAPLAEIAEILETLLDDGEDL